MNRNLARTLAALAACTASAPLAGPALAASADMGEHNAVISVRYWAGGGERNNVRVSMPAASEVVIRDRGLTEPPHAGQGWTMNYGCRRPDVVVGDGTYPITCQHPTRIDQVRAYLEDSDDRFALDSSVRSSVETTVYAEGGDDQIDVRGGSANDLVSCGFGIDWVSHDPGDRRGPSCETELLPTATASGAAIASWGPGRLDVFRRGPRNELRHSWYDGGSWKHDESLGFELTSDPAAVSPYPGRVDVFARGTDGALWYRRYADNRWGAWRSAGGYMWPGSGPAVAAAKPSSLHVFIRGTDSRLYVNEFYSSWDPDRGEWNGWDPLGGDLTSDPAAVSRDSGLVDVFVRGTDGALYQRSFDAFDGGLDGDWGEWVGRGGQLTSGPAVASPATGQLKVFVRGTDGGLWTRGWEYQGGSETGSLSWRSLGGAGQIASDPDAVSWGSGRVDLVVKHPDNLLYHLWLG